MSANAFQSLRRRLLSCLSLLGLGLGSTSALAADEPSYRFSPVNQASIALTADYWNPIMAYVSEKAGVRLVLKIGRTSADTTAYVLAQEVEFVFSNHLFSPEREQLGWKVIGRRLTPPIQGQLIVPADSPVTELAQLAGKDVVYPGPEAFVSYKVPYAQLINRKIDAKVVFAGNTDGALAQLFSGKVAAAGVNSQLAENYGRREGKKYRVLWSSEPLHDLALMASAKVPEKDVQAVARAFAGMHKDPKGKAILQEVSKHIGLTEEAYFITSDGSEYAPYRRFYQSAPAQVR
ncbi:phosphate/phosphite/phosphonate ABC transporter substrate-binding protein [Paucibacter sp. DJ2R-2]|uniref:phosphate/phosphite/phosphonate ABC transporter substrate-binding protein n=1 Tax=Paucibacter sp. DJ2R-2 TaxID=2893558 RepID=UPI0021E44CB3|nr:phosphate/phosphite/phosphonate ABC transporter substrate-binding protein [Paucibacter sp. DJ2R-2]MCV2421867.1 phosphate/phosphite/phosphonate ABC transporter substrate-binding protein [Paucibacter sp. DJ4R-1]MCV2439516.1 phosphate/phosphite/phosphonate ABC transporter substrate-binding protein [Paucibacter sp. DJ2R-2]